VRLPLAIAFLLAACGGPKIGTPCSKPADCGGDAALCLTAAGAYTGGYCSQLCGKDADCGAGAFCDTSTGDGLCVATCHASGDCRVSEGYACFTLPSDAGTRTGCLTPFPDAGQPTDGGTDAGP